MTLLFHQFETTISHLYEVEDDQLRHSQLELYTKKMH